MMKYEKFKEKLNDSNVMLSKQKFEQNSVINTVCKVIEDVYGYVITDDIFEEIEYNNSNDFKRGDYCYMAMVLDNGVRRTVAIGYKIDYCLKKAYQFTKAHPELVFTHVNKVLWGETKEEKKIFIKSNKL
nr:MAG TPA: hypothetical protein [Caudoviricetes sp.]